ncbi:MAG: response regulator [Spirochaetota bacterium]
MAKILIVDNDIDIVESITMVLRHRGHTAVAAYNGADGLTKAYAEKPDLIILDVMMETIEKGFEVCAALKSDGSMRQIPIIMLTAIKELPDMNYRLQDDGAAVDTDDPKAAATLKPEADAFYEKPIKPEELLRKVEELLAR